MVIEYIANNKHAGNKYYMFTLYRGPWVVVAVIHGYTWLYRVIGDYWWLFMVIQCYWWLLVVIEGYTWLYRGLYMVI